MRGVRRGFAGAARRALASAHLLAGLAVGALMIVPAASPGVAMADPAPETISGSGTVGGEQYSLSVSGGPYGQAPAGYLDVSDPTPGAYNFHATATCMNTGAQEGVIGFRIADGSNAGRGLLIAFAAPGSRLNTGSATEVMWLVVLPAPPPVCPPPSSPEPSFLSSGSGGPVTGPLLSSGGPVDPVPMQTRAFGLPARDATPGVVAQSPGGTPWFTEPGANRVALIADEQIGTVREYALPSGASAPSSIAPDLSGSCSSSGCADVGMWLTEPAAGVIGHVSASGATTSYAAPGGAGPVSIGGDVNGGAWFTEPSQNRIGFVSTTGRVGSYRVPTRGADPTAITSDSGATGLAGDGAWFTEPGRRRIGYIDGTGRITEYQLPTGWGAPALVVTDGASPAGAWFTETGTTLIGHIDAVGQVAQYPLPPGDAEPPGLAPGVDPSGPMAGGGGPGGNGAGVWFSQPAAGRVGYMEPNGQVWEFTVPGAHPGAIAFAPTLPGPALDGYGGAEGVWWTDPSSGSVGVASFPVNPPGTVYAQTQPGLKPEPQSRAAISLPSRISVRRSAVRLTLRCQGSIPCRGQAVLTGTPAPGSWPGATFATAGFGVEAGHGRVVTLQLNRVGRRQLAAHRRGLTTVLIVYNNHRTALHRLTVQLS